MKRAWFIGFALLASLGVGLAGAHDARAELARAAAAIPSIPLAAPSAAGSTGPARAFHPGDVFAGIGKGRFNHFDSAGTLIATLDDGQAHSPGSLNPQFATTGMCFDPSGNLYGTNLADNSMSKFSSDGTLLAATFGSFNAGPESCLVVNGSTIFTSQVSGTGDILKLDTSGALLASFDVRRSDWIDLAADQCSMFYSDEGPAIHRFDICTNKALPDFTTGGGEFFALRVLPDGTVLAASNTSVKRLDHSGALLATYTAPGERRLFALNLDPDGVHFWTGGLSGDAIYKFSIDPVGPAVLTFSPQVANGGGTGLAGVAIFGEAIASQSSPGPTTGQPSASPTTPPTTAPGPATTPQWLLAVLVVGVIALLVLLLLWRRRRRQEPTR